MSGNSPLSKLEIVIMVIWSVWDSLKYKIKSFFKGVISRDD